jgi:pimeloyl-ACP methyl ester carboxylesterase
VSRFVFFHGLESTVNEDLIPIGRKAQFLSTYYDIALPGLDTRDAIAHKDHCLRMRRGWLSDEGAAAAAFATPMRSARAAVTADTRIIVASSFGGAVLLKLLVEDGWRGGCVFLAGAGIKLTPHRVLPAGCPTVLIHGRSDDVVDPADSQRLARSASGLCQYWEVDDGHRLPSIMADGTLHAAIGLVEQALKAQ